MNEPTCCQWETETEHPDGILIYPELCPCICHVEDNE